MGIDSAGTETVWLGGNEALSGAVSTDGGGGGMGVVASGMGGGGATGISGGGGTVCGTVRDIIGVNSAPHRSPGVTWAKVHHERNNHLPDFIFDRLIFAPSDNLNRKILHLFHLTKEVHSLLDI